MSQTSKLEEIFGISNEWLDAGIQLFPPSENCSEVQATSDEYLRYLDGTCGEEFDEDKNMEGIELSESSQ